MKGHVAGDTGVTLLLIRWSPTDDDLNVGDTWDAYGPTTQMDIPNTQTCHRVTSGLTYDTGRTPDVVHPSADPVTGSVVTDRPKIHMYVPTLTKIVRVVVWEPVS